MKINEEHTYVYFNRESNFRKTITGAITCINIAKMSIFFYSEEF